ncbi:MAG: hypothetical protein FJ388_06880 [Verrucomicrobia bacterium]|nr:hypothetical protein [Verrucomicrobiota bacterium]
MNRPSLSISGAAWVVACVALAVVFLVGYVPRAREAHALLRQRNQIETQWLAERERFAQQSDYIRALATDPVVVDRLLRLKMKWARQNETLYRF